MQSLPQVNPLAQQPPIANNFAAPLSKDQKSRRQFEILNKYCKQLCTGKEAEDFKYWVAFD